MTTSADVIVIGAGSVGSMATWQLASSGHRVIAIDRSSVPGPFSGYAGESRLFRMIYREGGHYMPLLLQSRTLWQQLETESGRDLLQITGGVTISKPTHPGFRELLQSSEEQGLEYQLLTGEDASARLPLHRVDSDTMAFFDPNSGYVRSEQAVLAATTLARSRGAEFLEHRKVLGAEQIGNTWHIHTDHETVTAPRVIIASGTGAGVFCESLNTHLAIKPQVLTWFPILDPKAYAEHQQQIFLRYESDASFYGFPSADGWSIKVAGSVYLDETPSYDHPFEVLPEYLDTVVSYVEKYMPGLDPRPVRTATCADGYTADGTAMLGRVAGLDGVVSAVGLSGHGFKLAPAFGAIAAQLAVSDAPVPGAEFMNPNRFLQGGQRVSSLLI